jgi:phospholipase C
VSWIVGPTAASEHPGYTPGRGADYSAGILKALTANPDVWAKTAFIFTYDEDGGYFDHVPPPTPPPGTADEFVGGKPIGLGFRVPTVVCSPWTRGGYVCSTTYDHTSLIQFIERRFGVIEPQISAWRRATCGDLWDCFDFANPDYSIPALPPTAAGAQTGDARCQTNPPALPRLTNGPQPRQEAGTKPRRPCPSSAAPVVVRLPSLRGRRVLSGTITVAGKSRKLTARELQRRRVSLRGLRPGGTTAVRITLRVRGARRAVRVTRTLIVRCR